jgi:hypothetical protein
MSYYNYDPSKYIQDFSWVGDIGKAISSTALKMPELIELNKNIKENNKFKEMSYSSVNEYIDQLDPKIANSILSADGYAKEVNTGDFELVKAKLKEKIPKYSDKMTNEEYAKVLADSFFVPYMQAAQSDAAGNHTFGSLFGNLKSGVVQEAIRKSSVGQEMVADERENKVYGKGLQRKLMEDQMFGDINRDKQVANNAEDWKIAFKQKYGRDPMPGEGEQQAQASAQKTIEDQKLKDQQDLGKKRGKVMSDMISNSKSSLDVWDSNLYPEATDEMRITAAQQIRTQEIDDLKIKLKEMDASLKTSNQGKDKPVSVDQIQPIINSAQSLVTKYDALIKTTDSIKNSSVKKQLKAQYTQMRNEAMKRLDAAYKIPTKFVEGGEFTVGGLNKAYGDASKENERDYQNSINTIAQEYNSGRYKGFFGGNDKKKFLEDVYTIDPNAKIVFDSDGKVVMNIPTTVQPQGGGVKLNIGSQQSGDIVDVDDSTNPSSIPDGTIRYKGKVYIKKGNTLTPVK